MNIATHLTSQIAPEPDHAAQQSKLISMTAQIVSSYVQSNSINKDELPDLIDTIHEKLQTLSDNPHVSAANLRPAVPIEDSITQDHIICLEDGKPFKMLKKHLMSVYSLTPQEYRQKWNLAPDYPMVAPTYAAKRQELAKKSGLGRKRSV